MYPLHLNLIKVHKEFQNLYQNVRPALNHTQPTKFKEF